MQYPTVGQPGQSVSTRPGSPAAQYPTIGQPGQQVYPTRPSPTVQYPTTGQQISTRPGPTVQYPTVSQPGQQVFSRPGSPTVQYPTGSTTQTQYPTVGQPGQQVSTRPGPTMQYPPVDITPQTQYPTISQSGQQIPTIISRPGPTIQYPTTGQPSQQVPAHTFGSGHTIQYPTVTVPQTQYPVTGQPGQQVPVQISGPGSTMQYPTSVQPGHQLPSQYPGTVGQQVPVHTIGTSQVGHQVPMQYPGLGQPGQQTVVQYPSQIPGQVVGSIGQTTGTSQSGQQLPAQYPTGGQSNQPMLVQYPSQVVGSTEQLYPGTQYPIGQGSQVPQSGITGQAGVGQIVGTNIQYPAGQQIGTVQTPGGTSGVMYPGQGQYPSGQVFPDQGQYPQGQLPIQARPGGTVGTDGGTRTEYRGDIPVTVTYPGGTGDVAAVDQGTYQGNSVVSGQYPQVQVPDGLYPQSQIPGSVTTIQGTGGQNYQVSGNIPADDGSDSQAMSMVKQAEDGTHASASAEGKFGQGSAKSQVSGIYTGTGSFSAQAGSSDSVKSAQTQISGGKEGAKSSAQGSGGQGRSQTQVSLDSETGATSTNAQSQGWNHGTNSQVQASSKGGMADAQANGEGQTSSQAQIGFQPYKYNKNEKFQKLDKPFRGGGASSAQSGTFRGQTQSQLHGSFHYGITYTGAAQAGSGSGSAALRNKAFNFTGMDPNIFKKFKLDDKSEDEASTVEPLKEKLETSSSSRQTVIAITSRNKDDNRTSERHFQEDFDEYEDIDHIDNHPGRRSQNTRQTMKVITDGDYDVSVKRQQTKVDAKLDDDLSSFSVTSSPEKKVISIAGKKTVAQGDGKAHSQTLVLIPSRRRKTAETKSLVPYSARRLVVDRDPSEKSETGHRPVSKRLARKKTGKGKYRGFEHQHTDGTRCRDPIHNCRAYLTANGKKRLCKPKILTDSYGDPIC